MNQFTAPHLGKTIHMVHGPASSPPLPRPCRVVGGSAAQATLGTAGPDALHPVHRRDGDETGDRKKGHTTDYVATQYIGNRHTLANEIAFSIHADGVLGRLPDAVRCEGLRFHRSLLRYHKRNLHWLRRGGRCQQCRCSSRASHPARSSAASTKRAAPIICADSRQLRSLVRASLPIVPPPHSLPQACRSGITLARSAPRHQSQSVVSPYH